MTGEELSALIKDEIGEDARLHAILDRIRDGKANLTDSELYAAITARITAQQMRRNVLSLDKREAAFVDITRERYTDTFTVFSAVQRILDAENGIHIRPKEPGFDTGRARKIGHSLEDRTVPDSTIERRARSATENFCMSHHDDCMKVNAEFRARAGLQSYAIREGSAKCCDWCADVSGKYPANETPQGFWGRHDNCKCSILYESKRSGRQLLRGTSKKWEQVAPGAGAEPLVRLTHEQAQALQEKNRTVVLAAEQADQLNLLGKLKSLFSGQPYQSRITEFAEQLPDIQNRNVAKILRDALKSTEFAQSPDRRSVYHDGKVYLSRSATPSTIAHELFHRIDARNEITKRGLLDGCLKTDYERLKKLCESTGQTLEDVLYLKYKDAFSRPGKLKPDYRGVSDIIEGMTNGETRLGYGHIASDSDYWQKTGALSHETFAQYGRMYFDENPAVFEMLKEIFPDTTAQIDAIIPAIAQFGR